jgi:WD40 repeat protein
MPSAGRTLLLVALLVLPVRLASAGESSYARQAKPFFARYCVECHNADKLKGGLNLESLETLRQGGEHGPALVPAKPDESRLVLMVEGKLKPAMPPLKARQPRAEEVAQIRAWIADGAKDDGEPVRAVLPYNRPRKLALAPVSAVAYRPDGQVLAAATSNDLVLIDVPSGDVVGKLRLPIKVSALAFRPDGLELAVAGGTPAALGEVRLVALGADGAPSAASERRLTGHHDMIYALDWSPTGSILASAGYDRLIKLWDTSTGREVRTLKDHSDAVYCLAFHPEGRLLASCAADRALKVWDVASGRHLYTLAEATDWLYAVAWHPDGRRLAAAGVDRSIRVWSATPTGGKLVQSVFAHDGPVTKLAFSRDGAALYSAGEDRTVKTWDAARLIERRVYPKQPDAVLGMALRPDQHQLALGRYDGHLVLIAESTGQVEAELLPVRAKAPEVMRIEPDWAVRGQVARVVCVGKHFSDVAEVMLNVAGVRPRFLVEGRSSSRVMAEITIPRDTPAGAYELTVKSPSGTSNAIPFYVDRYGAIPEAEPNDTPGNGQVIHPPVSVAGAFGRPGDVDCYRFEASAGQQVGVQAVTASETHLEPVLTLLDASGNTLVEATPGMLGYTCHAAGWYTLEVRDRQYRGGSTMRYRLQIGDVPVVTSVFPLGLAHGTAALIHVDGVHLGTVHSFRVEAPRDAKPGSRVDLPLMSSDGRPLGPSSVVVGEFPEVVQAEQKGASSGAGAEAAHDALRLPVPGTANGRIAGAGKVDLWRFSAHAGENLVLEVEARRLGSPLDSVIEVLDAHGQPVRRAVLRSVAMTYTTFRDHDAAGPGIRLESWADLAPNDYVLAGDELMRVHDLPKTPDDDCRFFSVGGRRRAYLDTTPTFHSQGTPLYKVEIHAPDFAPPANGLPLVPVYYRNDDGGAGYGKDSRLCFDAPASGDYFVRVSDARGRGGPKYAYRLTVRPKRPDFHLSVRPTAPTIWRGGGAAISVSADRVDGFDSAIDVQVANLPPGLNATATSIPAGEETTAFAVTAELTAPVPATELRLVGRAVVQGTEVLREVKGGVPKLLDEPDLTVATEEREISVRPGGQAVVNVRIDRHRDFTGRVPIEVRGLPHGVHVLDVGLNGILIPETQTTRAFVIRAEPWVAPIEHPFVVLAKHEAKNQEYAAPSVLVRVLAQAR